MMKKIINELLSTFTMLSRVPLPQAKHFSLRYIGFFLPLLGVCIAAILYGLAQVLLMSPLSLMVIATLLLFFQYFFFNVFHLDGLLDTADAVLCICNCSRRHEILKDSNIGVYAFFVGFFVLFMKIIVLAELLSLERFFPLVFAYPVLGRTTSVILPFVLKPYAQKGLALALQNISFIAFLIAFLSMIFAFAYAFYYFHISLLLGFFSISLSIFLPLVIIAFIYKKFFQGYSGDALGALIELSELMFLFFIYLLLSV